MHLIDNNSMNLKRADILFVDEKKANKLPKINNKGHLLYFIPFVIGQQKQREKTINE